MFCFEKGNRDESAGWQPAVNDQANINMATTMPPMKKQMADTHEPTANCRVPLIP